MICFLAEFFRYYVINVLYKKLFLKSREKDQKLKISFTSYLKEGN